MRFLSYLRWQKGRTVRQVTSLRRGLVSPRGVPRSTPSDGSLNTVAESGAYTPGAWHPLWAAIAAIHSIVVFRMLNPYCYFQSFTHFCIHVV